MWGGEDDPGLGKNAKCWMKKVPYIFVSPIRGRGTKRIIHIAFYGASCWIEATISGRPSSSCVMHRLDPPKNTKKRSIGQMSATV